MRIVRLVPPAVLVLAIALTACDRGQPAVENSVASADRGADEARALDEEIAAMRLRAIEDAELNAQLANAVADIAPANVAEPALPIANTASADLAPALPLAADVPAAPPSADQLRAADAAVAAAMARRRAAE